VLAAVSRELVGASLPLEAVLNEADIARIHGFKRLATCHRVQQPRAHAKNPDREDGISLPTRSRMCIALDQASERHMFALRRR